MIEIRALGPVEILLDGGPPPAELLWRKHLALLVYLARSPRGTRTRDHLIGLLWSDKPESAARHSLNEALRVLRRAAGDAAIVTQVDQIILRGGDLVTLDVDAFEAAMGAGRIEQAAAMVLGEFLEGFSVAGAAPFEDWLAAERLHWAGRGVEALTSWGGTLIDRGRPGEAIPVLERALALEPLSEPALRVLMRAMALRGDRTPALEQFDAMARRLEERLGTGPGRETSALADRIRQERDIRGAPPTAPLDGMARRHVPLVGRDEELRQLLDAWASCRAAGRPRVAVVAGDSGSGRSRLSEELVDRVRLDGATVAVVRSVPADRDRPWSGLAALADGLADAPGVVGAPTEALAGFARHLASWAERFPAAGAALPLPEDRAFIEVIRVLSEEQPVLLWVDDAQWLDSASLLALGTLMRDLAEVPLLLLLTTGSLPPRDELDQIRARLGRELAGTTVRLGPLGTPDIRRLVVWAFPQYGEAETDRLTRRIVMDSAGLPLLAVELLDAVAAGMEIGRSAGAWPEPFRTLDQTLPGDLPDAVVAALRVSFRRLGFAAQRVLTAAAVLEDRVTAARLSHVLDMPVAEVHQALDELEWSRWISAERRGYSFVARIARDVIARDMLTPGQRQRILDAAG